MTNHVHIIIETTDKDVSDVIKRAHSRYGWNFNKKYKYIGHLVQIPNKIILISLIAIYITFVLYMTLLNRSIGNAIDYNLDLFWSYKHMLKVPGNYYFTIRQQLQI